MLRGCLTSGSIWLHSAGQFLVNVGWVFLVAWLPTYLTKELHVEPQRGAWMVTFVLAAGIFGQFAGGIAADWSVRRFGLRWGRMLPRAISAWIGGLAFGCCLLSNHPWALVACCAVVSFMTDLGTPCGASFVQDVGGRNTASIFGWGNMWGNLGAGASALLTPWLMQQGKTLELGASLAFLVYAGSFVLCGFLALGMDPRRMIVPPENELSTASPITAPPKASAAPALE
jgi:MFS family permease